MSLDLRTIRPAESSTIITIFFAAAHGSRFAEGKKMAVIKLPNKKHPHPPLERAQIEFGLGRVTRAPLVPLNKITL